MQVANIYILESNKHITKRTVLNDPQSGRWPIVMTMYVPPVVCMSTKHQPSLLYHKRYGFHNRECVPCDKVFLLVQIILPYDLSPIVTLYDFVGLLVCNMKYSHISL